MLRVSYGPLRGQGTADDPWRRADSLGNDWRFDGEQWVVDGAASREQREVAAQGADSAPLGASATTATVVASEPASQLNIAGRKRTRSSSGDYDSASGTAKSASAGRKLPRVGAATSARGSVSAAEEVSNDDTAYQSTSILLSRLPADVTVGELQDFCKVAGILKRHSLPDSAERVPHIWILQAQPESSEEREALVTFVRPESVDLAVDLLHERFLRVDVKHPVTVDKLSRQRKRELKERPEVARAARAKEGGTALEGGKRARIAAADPLQDLSWGEDERVVVVVRHFFTQDEAWEDPAFFRELDTDIRPEVAKFGEVKTFKIFEHHPDGVILVKFSTHAAAAACVKRLHGRWFGQRRLVADYYDGVETLDVRESDETRRKREQSWLEWIGGDDDEDDGDEGHTTEVPGAGISSGSH